MVQTHVPFVVRMSKYRPRRQDHHIVRVQVVVGMMIILVAAAVRVQVQDAATRAYNLPTLFSSVGKIVILREQTYANDHPTCPAVND